MFPPPGIPRHRPPPADPPAAAPHPPAPRVRWLLLFVLANVAAAGVGEGLRLIPEVSIIFWAPAGIFVATLLAADRRAWIWWTAAACAAELTGNALWFHSPWHLALLYFSANAIEAWTAALLVRWALRVGRAPMDLARLEQPEAAVLLCLLGGGVAPLIGATIIATTDALLGKESWATGWSLVWLGDATGLLVSAPVTLCLIQLWRNRGRVSAARVMELSGCTALVVAAVVAGLRGWVPTVYLCVPAMVWAAVRFRLVGAAIVLSATTIAVAACVRAGMGWVAGEPGGTRAHAVVLQSFLGVCALSTFIVASLSAIHARARDELERMNSSLDTLVRARTADLEESRRMLRQTLDVAATGLTRVSADLRYLSANPAYSWMMGVPLEKIVGRTMEEVLGRRAVEILRPHIDRVLQGERVEYEAHLPLASAMGRVFHVVYMPDRDAHGTVIGWVASITARPGRTGPEITRTSEAGGRVQTAGT